MWSAYFVTCLAVNFLVVFESTNAQAYTTFLGSSGGSALEPYKKAKQVRIDVYYETDCPDSMKFITSQLYPLYQEMKEILDIHLYPYGKAQRYLDDAKNDYSFQCHHGPSECYGNTVQACALAIYPNFEDALELINCMETYAKPSQSGRKCARRLGFDWDHINKCATGEWGEQLMHELANETEFLNPPLYFVPWIVFNRCAKSLGFDWEKLNRCATGELGQELLHELANETEFLNPLLNFVPWIVFNRVFDKEVSLDAVSNLKRVVCKKLKGYHAKCY